MPNLPDALTYGTIIAQIMTATVDGRDENTIPDSQPGTGFITFTPAPEYIVALPTGTMVRTPPVVVSPDVNGNLTVDLIATDNPQTVPTGFTYEVDTTELFGMAGGKFNIAIPAGSLTNLADLLPVSTSGGVITLRGPAGLDSTIPGPTGPASTVPGPTGPTGSTGMQGIQGIQGITGPQSTVPGPAAMVIVVHGTNPAVARPDVALVYWQGTVRPTAALATDWWLNA